MSDPDPEVATAEGGETLPPTDPELSALPKPRRPWRLATLVSLALVAICGSALTLALRSQIQYALASGQPAEVGDLSDYQPDESSANTWIHGSGVLSSAAVGYRRPLDGDRFRLAPVEGNPQLWVELREPKEARSEFFVPPRSFVGRLIPLSSPGLRHSELRRALEGSGQAVPSASAWLLVDGEAPGSSRWVLGLSALLLGFVVFSAWGLWVLLRPSHDVAA
jgi:hypothetical protein